jgi:hypothetical protein
LRLVSASTASTRAFISDMVEEFVFGCGRRKEGHTEVDCFVVL